MSMHIQLARQWIVAGSAVACTLAVAATTSAIIIRRRRPTAQQLEERRRLRLAAHGRIVDGSLVQTEPPEGEPRAVIYRYRIAGVTYECAQDVSAIPALVENLRLDYPVQVRYNRANPADSIIVAETWNGLWSNLWTSGRHTAHPRP